MKFKKPVQQCRSILVENVEILEVTFTDGTKRYFDTIGNPKSKYDGTANGWGYKTPQTLLNARCPWTTAFRRDVEYRCDMICDQTGVPEENRLRAKQIAKLGLKDAEAAGI